jgi:hypothetical protein
MASGSRSPEKTLERVAVRLGGYRSSWRLPGEGDAMRRRSVSAQCQLRCRGWCVGSGRRGRAYGRGRLLGDGRHQGARSYSCVCTPGGSTQVARAPRAPVGVCGNPVCRLWVPPSAGCQRCARKENRSSYPRMLKAERQAPTLTSQTKVAVFGWIHSGNGTQGFDADLQRRRRYAAG